MRYSRNYELTGFFDTLVDILQPIEGGIKAFGSAFNKNGRPIDSTPIVRGIRTSTTQQVLAEKQANMNLLILAGIGILLIFLVSRR